MVSDATAAEEAQLLRM